MAQEQLKPSTDEIVEAILRDMGRKAVVDFNKDGERIIRLPPFKCSICRLCFINGGNCEKGHTTYPGCDEWEYMPSGKRKTVNER